MWGNISFFPSKKSQRCIYASVFERNKRLLLQIIDAIDAIDAPFAGELAPAGDGLLGGRAAAGEVHLALRVLVH